MNRKVNRRKIVESEANDAEDIATATVLIDLQNRGVLENTASITKVKGKSSTKRRVHFEENPLVINITPLEDKQEGMRRLPDGCINSEARKDLESPEENGMEDGGMEEEDEEELALELPVSSSKSRNVAEHAEDSNQCTNPPVIPRKKNTSDSGSVSRRTRVFRCSNEVPKIDLEQSPGSAQNGNIYDSDARMEERSLLSGAELNAFNKGVAMKTKVNSQLWSAAFAPNDRDEIIGGGRSSNYTALTDWLGKWLEQMKKRREHEDAEGKRKSKRKRKNGFLEEEEDENFEVHCGEALPNPMILTGASGAGKTTMVYCAAQENGFQVLEIPTYEKRDKQSLEQKLSGAVANHNVNKGHNFQMSIRDMFSPNRMRSPSNCLKRKSSTELTLILIDEADLTYSVDTNFWSTLKTFCAGSQVPILLTCNDYGSVRDGLLGREPVLDTYNSLHLEAHSTPTFTKYFRHWFMGFTGQLLKNATIGLIFAQKRGDIRAILNALQFQGGEQKTPYSAGSLNESNEQIAVSIREIAHRAKRVAMVDSACGKATGGRKVMWRAKLIADLDYTGSAVIKDWWTKNEEMAELRAQIMDMLTLDADWIQQIEKPIDALSCACLRRSLPNRIYSTREAAVDYLPCLVAIDRAALHAQRQCSSRRPLHPFDTVDPESGAKIDQSHDLKYFLAEYSQCFVNMETEND